MRYQPATEANQAATVSDLPEADHLATDHQATAHQAGHYPTAPVLY